MDNIRIDNYDIFINVDLIKYRYIGHVIIKFKAIKELNNLLINCIDFTITDVFFNNHKINYSYNKEILNIEKNVKIEETSYIKIKFSRYLNNEPFGFYYTKLDGHTVYSTHFEPENCRYFIPCFDKPDLKSTFNLSVMYKQNDDYKCLSNMDIYYQKNVNGYTYIKFKSTPRMSNYLLNLVIGPYVSINEKPVFSKSGVRVHCYCFAQDVKLFKWTIPHFINAIDLCEMYFKQVYVLPKLDYIYVPNYTSNATEHWGLISFNREHGYLKTNLDKDKIDVLDTIYHEIIHQWIGNLVTNKRWDEIWLNESITNYITWLFLKLTYVNMDVDFQYYIDTYVNAILDDCFTHTQPIKRDVIYSNEIFNSTIYKKGAVILNYIINFMGKDCFLESIRNFISKHKYLNVTTNNFIDTLCEYQDKIPNKLFRDIIIKNLENNGYPLLKISKNGNKISINMTKFNSECGYKKYQVEIYLDYKLRIGNNIIKKSVLIDTENSELKLGLDEDFLYTNPNNNLLCVVLYDRICAYKFMEDIEILKYMDDQYILVLYGYIELDLMIKKMKELYNFLIEKNDILSIVYWLSLHLKLLKILKFFKPIDSLINKFSYLKKIISETSLFVEKINGKSQKKYELINTLYKLKIIFFKDNKTIKYLYNLYLEEKYNNLILDSIITNIVINYPEETLNLYEKIIINNELDNFYIIKSLQYIDVKNFNQFIKRFINIITFSNTEVFFKNVTSNCQIVKPVISMIVSKHKLIDDKLMYEIINGSTINLFDMESISLMRELIEKELVFNPNNNYLLNLDYLKTNIKIVERFNF